jgi:hypothetical protein
VFGIVFDHLVYEDRDRTDARDHVTRVRRVGPRWPLVIPFIPPGVRVGAETSTAREKRRAAVSKS